MKPQGTFTEYGDVVIRYIDLKTYETENKILSRQLMDDYRERGKQLFQLTSDVTKDKLERFIESKTKILPKIGARKCKVGSVDSVTYKEFLNKYHIQGSANSHIRFGLFYESELVAVMGFIRYEDGYNLNRLAYGEYSIAGGASKLLRAFREICTAKIITYSNLSYSDGSVYAALGFKRISESKQDLWYINPNGDLINRRALQKKRLVNFPEFDVSLTEREILERAGYRNWHGPGTIRWELDSIEPKKKKIPNEKFRDSEWHVNNIKRRIEDGSFHMFSSKSKQKLRERTNAAIQEGRHNSQIKYTCPHCNKEGNGPMMKRWHFDNCKHKQ